MKTSKKFHRGGVLLLALILAVNMLMPASAWAAPQSALTILIDGESVSFCARITSISDTNWTEDPSSPFTADSDGYVIYNGCHLTLDGTTLVLNSDGVVNGGSYTTVPISSLDFTAPESLSMRATQGHSDLAIAPCVITNTGGEDLKLSQVEINAASGWSVVNASTDFTTADSKNKIAFTAGSHDFSGGAYTPNEKIAGGSSTTLQLAGKISEKADLTNATQVASMVLTIEKNVNLISFTITDSYSPTYTYQAEEGMTWGEWIESSYNTDGYYISGVKVLFSSNGHRVVYEGNNPYRPNDLSLFPDDLLISDYAYRGQPAKEPV